MVVAEKVNDEKRFLAHVVHAQVRDNGVGEPGSEDVETERGPRGDNLSMSFSLRRADVEASFASRSLLWASFLVITAFSPTEPERAAPNAAIVI